MVIRYRSPSALWAIDRVLVLTGLGFVIASLNVAIGAFATEFRDEFRLWRHLLVPVTAAVLFLFPCAGSSIRVRSRHVPQTEEEKGCDKTKAIVDREAVVSYTAHLGAAWRA
jgi:hypothetical protein